MVVFEWFERFLVPVAAPDENYEPAEERSFFWEMVAPDPNFSPPQSASGVVGDDEAREAAASFLSLQTPASSSNGLVECQYCHRLTPSSSSTSKSLVLSTPAPTPPSGTQEQTTTPQLQPPSSSNSLDHRLREAARSTLLLSSPGYQHKRKKVQTLFKLISDLAFYNDAKHSKVQALIVSDPQLLVYARVSKSEALYSVPEGYTPLHVAAFQGNVRAAQLFLSTPTPVPGDIAIEIVQQTTQQGETALHLACTYGHEDVVQVLQQFLSGHDLTWQAHDVLGRTPLAAGLTSPQGKVRAASLIKTLLKSRQEEEEDACIFGKPIPPSQRCYYSFYPHAVVAVSEMPGRRAQMEDTTLVAFAPAAAAPGEESSLSAPATASVVGVLDGHEDGGTCSQATARHLERHLLSMIQQQQQQQQQSDNETAIVDIFQTVDDELRYRDPVPGGSTACVAIVTEHLIQVANVGDSRCILVQAVPSQEQKLEEEEESLVEPLEASLNQLSLLDAETATTFSVGKKKFAIAGLSRDHKPDLANERARIKAAGLKVQSIQYQEKGELKVVHKVVCATKSTNEIDLAVSRSFGDFEFKNQKGLPADQQAIVAVPEIVTRDRSKHDALLIMACDGIWDVMTSKDVAEFVTQQVLLHEGDDHVLATVADQLCRKCFDLDSDDNMSVVLVALGATAERVAPFTRTDKGIPRALDFGSPGAAASSSATTPESPRRERAILSL